jgi:Putative zinc-finger
VNQTWSCAEARGSLGVYVLGAIDPAERGLVDAHLSSCRDCRDELAGLAGLPALLARVNPDEISRICADDAVPSTAGDEPPEELLGTVLGLAEARRRRNRWRYLSAAAAVIVIAGGLFGGLQAATSTTTTRTVVVSAGPGSWETTSATSQATGVSATVAYSHELWGSAFQVLVDHIPAGTTCELWVVHPDGTRTQVAAWTTSRDEGKAWYTGSMAASAGSIGQFEITAGNQVLLQAAPAEPGDT